MNYRRLYGYCKELGVDPHSLLPQGKTSLRELTPSELTQLESACKMLLYKEARSRGVTKKQIDLVFALSSQLGWRYCDLKRFIQKHYRKPTIYYLTPPEIQRLITTLRSILRRKQ